MSRIVLDFRPSKHLRFQNEHSEENCAVKNESSLWLVINNGASMLRSVAISSFKLISTLINEGQASGKKFCS